MAFLAYDDDVSTVGCACANTEVKIVAAETGETVPAGKQGVLCTRGYLVMKGYDRDPEATRKAVDTEGWLHTGDLARRREYLSARARGRRPRCEARRNCRGRVRLKNGSSATDDSDRENTEISDASG